MDILQEQNSKLIYNLMNVDERNSAEEMVNQHKEKQVQAHRREKFLTK